MTSSFLAGPDATDPSAVNPLGSEPLVGNPNDRKDETILGSPSVHDQVGSNPLPPGETPVALPNYNFGPATAPLGPIGEIAATSAIASETPPIRNYDSGGGGGACW